MDNIFAFKQPNLLWLGVCIIKTNVVENAKKGTHRRLWERGAKLELMNSWNGWGSMIPDVRR